MRKGASRDEYVPQHGSRYETKGTSSRGLADARIRGVKIAAIGMLTLAVIILGITAKTYASERMALIINFIRTPPTFIRTCADECGNPIP